MRDAARRPESDRRGLRIRSDFGAERSSSAFRPKKFFRVWYFCGCVDLSFFGERIPAEVARYKAAQAGLLSDMAISSH